MKSLSYLQLKKNCARTPETPDGTRFALLGDWLSHRSYLMLDGERFDLRFWDAGSGGGR